MPITVYTENKAQQIADPENFKKNFHLIKAAGGTVIDDKERILLIFRKGKWDLPKGKLEDNEPLELCAEREIKEETGLNELELKKTLLITYHTYSEKGKSILKETHWFLFAAPGNQEVQPQTEEDISIVEWVEKNRLGEYLKNSYQLIRDVLSAAGY